MFSRNRTLGLLSASALACGLLAVRVLRTERLAFAFLVWNLFLAWAPLLLSASLCRLVEKRSRFAVLVGVAWWLFFPNAFYLVTDLVHLRPRPDVPHWYDTAMLVAFAWSGTWLAIASLGTVHGVVRERFGRSAGWAFVAFVCLSTGFGIWLGRVQRYNSWDVLLRPLELARAAFHALAHPLREPAPWAITFAFGGILAVSYLIVGSMRESAHRAA